MFYVLKFKFYVFVCVCVWLKIKYVLYEIWFVYVYKFIIFENKVYVWKKYGWNGVY